MKPSLVILTTIAILGAAFSSSQLMAARATPSATASANACSPLLPPQATPAGQTRMYGHIKSLTRKRHHFELRFDPAWWLTGVPAERAAVEDKAIRPGEPVPNDYYIVDEGHRLLTFVVPTTARVTVLPGGKPCTAATSVAKLAEMVKNGNVRLGFWIRIGEKYPSPVLSVDQQYQP